MALAAPIGSVLSGNFHLSHWAGKLHDRTSLRSKNFQLGGELLALYADRLKLLPFKEQCGIFRCSGLWEFEASVTLLCCGRAAVKPGGILGAVGPFPPHTAASPLQGEPQSSARAPGSGGQSAGATACVCLRRAPWAGYLSQALNVRKGRVSVTAAGVWAGQTQGLMLLGPVKLNQQLWYPCHVL